MTAFERGVTDRERDPGLLRACRGGGEEHERDGERTHGAMVGPAYFSRKRSWRASSALAPRGWRAR